MKFTCNKNDLGSAIAHVLKAVSPKSPVPVMEGICIQTQENQIILTGYNLEIGIRTSVPAECDAEVTFVLNAKLFSEMTRRMSGEEITLEIDDMFNASLVSENTKYQLSAMSAEEFPELPVVESMAKTTVSQQMLRSMIQESSFAASVKEDKPILTGELFESSEGTFYIVAMDRYRLALRQEQIQDMEDFHFVVPKKALNELINMMKDDAEQPCEFYTNGKHIVFSVNGFELFARLLEGQFHNFRASIPAESKTTVIVYKKDIMACAERCSLLIDDKNKAPMRCAFADGYLEISCKTAIGAVHDRIPADISGDSLTIGFSNKYLSEALRSCQCDKLRFQMSGSNKVIKITPVEDESFIYLIMPIQLKE